MKKNVVYGILFLSAAVGITAAVVLSVWARRETFSLWINILLLLLLGSLYLVIFSVKKIFDFSRKIDVFSPYIIFPLVFAFIIGVGSLPSLVDSVEEYQGLFKFYFIGLIAYFLGLLFVKALYPKEKNTNSPGDIDTWDWRRSEKALLVIFGLGLLAIILFAVQARLPIFASDVVAYRFYIRQKVSRVGTLLNLSLSMQVVFIVAVVYLIKNRRKTLRKTVVFSLAVLSLLSLFLWASRGRVIIPLITAFFCFHYLKKRMSVRFIVAVFAIVFLIFSFTGMRRLQTVKPEYRESIIQRSWSELHVIPRNFLVVRENFPQRHQFLKGKVISYPFTTVLPGYQPQIGEVLKEKLGLGFIGGGFAFSLIGGLYLDFGVMSIILGMFFLGVLMNFLYQKMKPDYQAFYVLLYCFTCVRALDAIRSYIFLNFSYFWVVFCLIAIHWYCTKKSQKWMNIKVVKDEKY